MTRRNSFAEILRRERRALSMTQRELAEKIGVDTSHIASFEIERRKPSPAVVERIANVLNLDKRKLFLLTRPEARAIMGSVSATIPKPKDPDQAWRELISDRAMLRRYRVTPRELRALKQLNLLGYVLTPREFLTIVTVIRRGPEEADYQPAGKPPPRRRPT